MSVERMTTNVCKISNDSYENNVIMMHVIIGNKHGSESATLRGSTWQADKHNKLETEHGLHQD